MNIKIISITAFAIFTGALSYCHFGENHAKQSDPLAELTYKTTNDWAPYPPGSKHVKNGLQYHKGDDGMIIRKVYLTEEKKIYVFGQSPTIATVFIMFHAPCDENSEIQTAEKYSSGHPILLECVHGETGTFLSAGITSAYDTKLNYNFGGFRVNEDLSTWQLDPVIREQTLKAARPVAPQKP